MGIVENTKGAIDTTRAVAALVKDFPKTPNQVEAFLNKPDSVKGLLDNAAVIAKNADNPLVQGPLKKEFLKGVESSVRTVSGPGATPDAAKKCAATLIDLVNKNGGAKAIAEGGKAMTQCLALPVFTKQLNATQQDVGALVKEIGKLNSQVNDLFPGLGDAAKAAMDLSQGILKSVPRIPGLGGGRGPQ